MNTDENIISHTPEEDNDDDINDLSEEEIDEEIIPEKVKINPDDVFKKKVKKKIIEEKPAENLPVIEKVKNRGGYKRTMTPKALASLEKAREKGLETRRRNKELKEAGKVEQIPLSKAKQTKKQIQQETLDKIKPIQNITNNVTNNITHEDIIRISKESAKNALIDYELVRKQRKEEKKKANESELARKEVVEKIQQAQGNYYQPNSKKYGQPGFWRNAFY